MFCLASNVGMVKGRPGYSATELLFESVCMLCFLFHMCIYVVVYSCYYD